MSDHTLELFCGRFYDKIRSIYAPVVSNDPHFRTFVVQHLLCDLLADTISQYFNEKPDVLNMVPDEEKGDEAMFADMNERLYRALWLMNQNSEQIEAGIRVVVPINEFIAENLELAREIYQDILEGETSGADEEDDEMGQKAKELVNFLEASKIK